MPVTAEQLLVDVRADVAQALTSLKQVEAQTARTAANSSKSFVGMSRSFAGAFGATAIIGGIGKTLSLAKDFDLTIRQVGVQTKQSGKGLANLSDLAKQMGQDTIYSAQDAGQAMLELAKGGLSAAELKSGALNTTLLLASAGGLDLANSAAYVTQAMTTFGIKADSAQQVATALAGGANASTASVESLGQALSQVGPGATNAGMSLQETVAALAAFDNAGIKGADAGTSFKTFLTSLVPATDKARNAMSKYNLEFVDSDGNFKSLASISENLKQNLKGLSQEQRTQALRTIFGSDATRAASVLMNNGAKGVRKYISATKDQKAAQDLANTAMSGASGAWENFTGTVETAAIGLGEQALPLLTDGLNQVSALIQDAGSWGPDVAESLGWIKPIAEGAGDALLGLAHGVGEVAGWFNDLPAGVKQTVIQVGLAAAVFPRLAAAAGSAQARVVGAFTTMGAKARQFGAEMTYAQTRTQRLGEAAKAAAGIGGMVLLAKASDQSSDSMKGFMNVAGGALVGLSVGGPIGAVVGGLAGGFQTLNQMSSESRENIRKSIQVNKDYASSFDQVSGAITKATRQTAFDNLSNQGDLDISRAIGIPDREMVLAATGNVDALARIQARVKELTGTMDQLTSNRAKRNPDLFFFNKQSASDFISGLRNSKQNLTEEQQAFMKSLQASQGYAAALKQIPKRAQTDVKALGIAPTAKQVADLAKQYKLTPKEIRSVLKFTGSQKVRADLAEVQAKMDGVRKSKPDLSGWTNGLLSGIAKGVRSASKGGKDTADNLDKGPKRAKADLGRWVQGITSGVASGLGEAAKGSTVGSTLKNSVISGFAGTQATLVAQAVAAVRAAIAAAKAAGGGGGGGRGKGGGGGGGTERSSAGERVAPRESTRARKDTQRAVDGLRQVGRQVAHGVADGIRARTKDGEDDAEKEGEKHGGKAGSKAAKAAAKAAKEKAKRERERLRDAGKSILQDFLQGLKDGGEGINSAVEKITGKWARKALGEKAAKQFIRGIRRQNEALQALYAERAGIAAQLDGSVAGTAQNLLDQLRQSKQDLMTATMEGISRQATVLNAGNNATTIRASLEAQLAKAREFAGLLNTLKGMGYGNAILTQIASAGIEGGLEAARALATASPADQAAIQGAFDAIQATATGAAQSLGSSMYDAGIQAAEAVVTGLQSRQAALDAQIATLGQQMADRMRDALEKAGKKGGKQFGDSVIEQMPRVGEKFKETLDNAFAASLAASRAQTGSAIVPAGNGGGGGGGGNGGGGGHGGGGNSGIVPAPRGRQGVTMQFNTYNPVAEPQSRTTNKALERVATLGWS